MCEWVVRLQANGLTYVSPGQRPGLTGIKPHALKGQTTLPSRSSSKAMSGSVSVWMGRLLRAPLQGFFIFWDYFQGRCPGLTLYAPLARSGGGPTVRNGIESGSPSVQGKCVIVGTFR